MGLLPEISSPSKSPAVRGATRPLRGGGKNDESESSEDERGGKADKVVDEDIAQFLQLGTVVSKSAPSVIRDTRQPPIPSLPTPLTAFLPSQPSSPPSLSPLPAFLPSQSSSPPSLPPCPALLPTQPSSPPSLPPCPAFLPAQPSLNRQASTLVTQGSPISIPHLAADDAVQIIVVWRWAGVRRQS